MGESESGNGGMLDRLRDVLEGSLLPAYLPTRRWFASKSRAVRAVRLVDATLLTARPASELALAIFEVARDDGERILYQIPLILQRVSDPVEAARLDGHIGLASIEGEPWLVRDALTDAEVAHRLLERIAAGGERRMRRGMIRAVRGTAFDALRGPDAGLGPIRLSAAEQSHSNVSFGDRLLLKVFRKLDAGINPDVEIGRALTERTSFRNMPRVGGSLEYQAEDGASYTTAVLQEYVPSRGQGWEFMLGLLRDFFAAAAAGDSGPQVRPIFKTLNTCLADVAILAERTGELHTALAGLVDDPDFVPEPFAAEDWQRTRRDLLAQADQTRTSLESSAQRIPEALAREARTLLDSIPAWLERQDAGGDVTGLGARIRIHGDYHLGQTLRTADDYVILDFEGEPAKPVASRRAKQSPLRDVAGMLRSFDYAAHAALDAARDAHPGRLEALERWGRAWVDMTSTTFLAVYQVVGAGADWYPADPARGRALLGRLLVEKALYELDYELNNRPTWISIPLRGLQTLVRS
jgi:maltose alpha-D-glucosyltransferase/alpha-amylase